MNKTQLLTTYAKYIHYQGYQNLQYLSNCQKGNVSEKEFTPV